MLSDTAVCVRSVHQPGRLGGIGRDVRCQLVVTEADCGASSSRSSRDWTASREARCPSVAGACGSGAETLGIGAEAAVSPATLRMS
jgi:hypothetical protein